MIIIITFDLRSTRVSDQESAINETEKLEHGT